MIFLTNRKTRQLVELLGRSCLNEVLNAKYSEKGKKLNDFVGSVMSIFGKTVTGKVLDSYEVLFRKKMEELNK